MNKYTLIPSRTIGSSTKNFELLRILDNTYPIFDKLELDNISINSNDNTFNELYNIDTYNIEDENIKADIELEKKQFIEFNKSSQTNRAIYNNYLRNHSEIYFLLNDWVDKQKRKLVDIKLRNVDVWTNIIAKKNNALVELNYLLKVIKMLKYPPTKTVLDNRQANNNVREAALCSAYNHVKVSDELAELKLALKTRKEFLNHLITCSQRFYVGNICTQSEFDYMNKLLYNLSQNWNIIKVPYELQVYLTPGNNYPFKMEFWIELLYVPDHIWGFEIFDDLMVQNAKELWEFTEQVSNTKSKDNNDAIQGKFCKMKKNSGLPYFQTYPKPNFAPIGNRFWCEIFASSKKDEEKLPEKLLEFLSPSNQSRKNASINNDKYNKKLTDENEIVNIFLQLNKDLTIDYKLKKTLQFYIQIDAIPNISYDSFKNTFDRNQSHNYDMSSDVNLNLHTNAALESQLQHFLIYLQKQCLERSIFYVLQGQVIRSMTNQTQKRIDESIMKILKRLNDIDTISANRLDNIILITVKEEIDFLTINSRLQNTILPPSFMSIPIMIDEKTARYFVCFPISCQVTNCDSSNIDIQISDIPIFNQNFIANPHINALCEKNVNITLHIFWDYPKAYNIYISKDATIKEKQYIYQIEYIEKMSVIRLRHTMTEILLKNKYVNVHQLVDFCESSSQDDKNIDAKLFWSNYISWLLTQLATINFNFMDI